MVLENQFLKLQAFNRINGEGPFQHASIWVIIIAQDLHRRLVRTEPNVAVHYLILEPQVNIINGYQPLLGPAHSGWAVGWDGGPGAVSYAARITVGSVNPVARGECGEALVEIEEVLHQRPCLCFGDVSQPRWNLAFPSLMVIGILLHFGGKRQSQSRKRRATRLWESCSLRSPRCHWRCDRGFDWFCFGGVRVSFCHLWLVLWTRIGIIP